MPPLLSPISSTVCATAQAIGCQAESTHSAIVVSTTPSRRSSSAEVARDRPGVCATTSNSCCERPSTLHQKPS